MTKYLLPLLFIAVIDCRTVSTGSLKVSFVGYYAGESSPGSVTSYKGKPIGTLSIRSDSTYIFNEYAVPYDRVDTILMATESGRWHCLKDSVFLFSEQSYYAYLNSSCNKMSDTTIRLHSLTPNKLHSNKPNVLIGMCYALDYFHKSQ